MCLSKSGSSGSVLLYVQRTIRDGEPRTATSTSTQLLSCEVWQDISQAFLARAVLNEKVSGSY